MKTSEKYLLRQKEPKLEVTYGVSYINYGASPYSVAIVFRDHSLFAKYFEATMSADEADKLADDLKEYAKHARQQQLRELIRG
jgi:hypothetical protein